MTATVGPFTPPPAWQSVLPIADDSPAHVDYTPVVDAGDYLVKRDDLYVFAGQRGGKVRTCRALALKAMARGPLESQMRLRDVCVATKTAVPFGLITAGSRSSPQVNIVAAVGKELGLPVRAHTPGGAFTPEMTAAQDAGATIIQHMPGHNSVIVARAREEARLFGWHEIPFGMECAEAVLQTSLQVGNLPADIERLVVPVGSGMSLAGILKGLLVLGRTVPIVAVQVGADPSPRLDRYAPGWRQRVQVVKADRSYHKPADVVHLPDGTLLDPIYEAKCLPYLRPGDCLWVVGIRQTATEPAPPAPTGSQWRISGKWSRHRLTCNAESIPTVCGGMCCRTQAFWPARAGVVPDACDHLGPAGCTLDPRDRPVTCHLYPLKVNPANTMVAHFAMVRNATHSPCVGNYGHGPTIIESLSGSLATLFGEDQAAKAVADVLAGGDAVIDVPPAIMRALEREEQWARDGVVPLPRRSFDDANLVSVAPSVGEPRKTEGQLDAVAPA